MEKKFTTLRGNVGGSFPVQSELFPINTTDPSSPKGVDSGKRVPLGEAPGGLRYDRGKNRLDLIPPEWEWELGKVLTAGAEKYDARNWELGMDWGRVVGPLRRHLNCFLRGEQLDQETQCHHLAHVAWNALALLSYDLRGIGRDDLNRQDCVKNEHRS
jgi:hypothetical protein